MTRSITITKAHLQAALQAWEEAARRGHTITDAERAKLSPEQNAKNATPYLFEMLAVASKVES